jgi:hypothetical protein
VRVRLVFSRRVRVTERLVIPEPIMVMFVVSGRVGELCVLRGFGGLWTYGVELDMLVK